MNKNQTRFMHIAAGTILAASVLSACAVAGGATVEKENVYSEATTTAEAVASTQPTSSPSTEPTNSTEPTSSADGITVEEAKQKGVYAAAGDALITNYEMKSNDPHLVVQVDVENISGVEDVYEVQIVTEDGRKASSSGPIPAESTASFEVIIQGSVQGNVAVILNGELLGSRVDAEALNVG